MSKKLMRTLLLVASTLFLTYPTAYAALSLFSRANCSPSGTDALINESVTWDATGTKHYLYTHSYHEKFGETEGHFVRTNPVQGALELLAQSYAGDVGDEKSMVMGLHYYVQDGKQYMYATEAVDCTLNEWFADSIQNSIHASTQHSTQQPAQHSMHRPLLRNNDPILRSAPAPLQRPAMGFHVESMNSMQLPDKAKAELIIQIERNKKGDYSTISNDQFISLTGVSRKISSTMDSAQTGTSSMENIIREGKLISNPSAVNGTILDNAILLSSTTAGVYQQGQWSGLSRIYFTKELGIVMLDENDYASVGGRIVMAQEAINESVHAVPAILVIKESASGENLIQLTWTTNRKDYVLSSNAVDLIAGKKALLSLARGIRD